MKKDRDTYRKNWMQNEREREIQKEITKGSKTERKEDKTRQ